MSAESYASPSPAASFPLGTAAPAEIRDRRFSPRLGRSARALFLSFSGRLSAGHLPPAAAGAGQPDRADDRGGAHFSELARSGGSRARLANPAAGRRARLSAAEARACSLLSRRPAAAERTAGPQIVAGRALRHAAGAGAGRGRAESRRRRCRRRRPLISPMRLRDLPVTASGLKFRASSREAPESARFRVAVDSLGVVRYTFSNNPPATPRSMNRRGSSRAQPLQDGRRVRAKPR